MTQEPRWLSQKEQEAWRAYLRGTTQAATLLSHDLVHKHGITLNKYEVMVRLSEAPDHTMRMSHLAENLVHSRSRLTRTVMTLEEDGLVERTKCTEDKRGRYCRLTDKGYELLKAAAPLHIESVRRRIIDRVGKEDFLELGRIMKKMIDESESVATSYTPTYL